jgi:hypothetical protein
MRSAPLSIAGASIRFGKRRLGYPFNRSKGFASTGSREVTAAIPGSLHQSGTKPETPQETWGSGCRHGDVPLRQSRSTPVKWIPQSGVITPRLWFFRTLRGIMQRAAFAGAADRDWRDHRSGV